MLHRQFYLSGLIVLLASVVSVRADIIVFKVPTTSLKFVLQGKATIVRSQPTLSFAHVSKATFDLPQGEMTDVIVLPTLNQIGSRRVLKAKSDAGQMRDAAVWCLEHGLMTEFYRAVDQLAALDSGDTFAIEAKKLKESLAKPIADDAKAEAAFQKAIGNNGMTYTRSAHFVLLHGEPEKGAGKRRKPETRLEQLELLYEMFVMKCAERGLPVTIPAHKFQVALISNPKSQPEPSRTMPRDSDVVWSPGGNALAINETAKAATLDALRKLQSDAQKQASQPKTRRNQPGAGAGQPAGAPPGAAPMAGGLGTGAEPAGGGAELFAQLTSTQLAKLLVTFQALVSIGTENQELENVSREAAYLFIQNCDVVPSTAPRWVRDGLATYFEIPAETGLIKIGDLGTVRNAWYQATLLDSIKLTLDDVVNDRVYDGIQSPNEALRATTLAWAVSHFLLQTNREGLVNYLNACRELPPDVVTSPSVMSVIFKESFGSDSVQMESDFREYMTGLKPSYELLREEEAETASAASEN